MDSSSDALDPAMKRSSFRTHHRAKSHDSAHATSDSSSDLVPRPMHSSIPVGDASFVATATELSHLIDRLRTAGSFAYDSEFIGELTYFPKLCLIQVASRSEVALIDPLQDFSLAPFWELLCDPAVEKIVHAGEQDIEPVIRNTGRPPANVFDTQIAAGFTGLSYPLSLSKLVMEFTGAFLGKGLTFSHWDKRPLSPLQLRYAADDVRYLPLVRERLGEALQHNGHQAWAVEECSAECDVSVYRFDPATHYLRVRGAMSLDSRNLAVLRELTGWRDAAARSHDVPPRTFLRDEVMIELARSPVKSVEKLNRVKGLPRPVELAHGARIVEITLRALALPADQLPPQRPPDPSPRLKFATDALWAVAQCICAGQSIDPSLSADRQEVGELIRLFTSNADLSQLRLMQGWRRRALGDRLLAMLQGKAKMQLTWADALVTDVVSAVSD